MLCLCADLGIYLWLDAVIYLAIVRGYRPTILDAAMDKDDWTKDRVAYLKGLKTRTDHQELLVLLFDKPDRDKQDDRKLDVLVRAEKAAVRASKARQEAANLIRSEDKAIKEAERKARTKRLIDLGGLVDLAGISAKDKGELLGAFLGLSRVVDEERWAKWKQEGDALLAEREQEKSKT